MIRFAQWKMNSEERMNNEAGRSRLGVWICSLLILPCSLLAGCQQKMADQPALRPYTESNLFPNKQSARPIERGTVHVSQHVVGDPLATWLTEKGRTPTPAYPNPTPEMKDVMTVPGAPTDNANFVAQLPFAMTAADYKRGQLLFRAVCAECHGAAGHGDGKVPERGFLRPPSYHRDSQHPTGNDEVNAARPNEVLGARDWSSMKPGPGDRAVPEYTDHPQGFSRGFSRLGIRMPLDKVNVGYIFQVITWGYGGMGSHTTQIPDPADRWRVVAYVRALQLSQLTEKAKLSTELQHAIDHPPVKNKTDAPAEGKH